MASTGSEKVVNVNDLPRWIVCSTFPKAGYRHGVVVVGTQPQRGQLLRTGIALLRNWARDKDLNQDDAEFQIHLETERENCRVCVPAPQEE